MNDPETVEDIAVKTWKPVWENIMKDPETIKEFMHYLYGYLTAILEAQNIGVKPDARHILYLISIMDNLDDFEPDESWIKKWYPYIRSISMPRWNKKGGHVTDNHDPEKPSETPELPPRMTRAPRPRRRSFQIFREEPGVIANEEMWVCIAEGYMYNAPTIAELISILNTGWKSDKYMIG